MQRYFFNLLIVFFMFLLIGCQSNQRTTNLFNPLSPLMTPSANLEQSVRDALLRSEDPALERVHVQTREDVVILSGYVKKIRQSDIAEQIARQVPGVRGVENNIIIRP